MSSATSHRASARTDIPGHPVPSVRIDLRADRATDLDVGVSTHDCDSVTVALIGEIDVTNADVLDRALQDQAVRGRRFVRVDLSGVTFCDYAGLHPLVEAHNRQLACRGTLVLTGVAPIIARLLAISHLDEALFVADGPGDPPHVRKVCRRPSARRS